MAERLSEFVSVAKAKNVLLEAFIVVVENGVGRSHFEDKSEDENRLGISRVSLYCQSSSHSGVGEIEFC